MDGRWQQVSDHKDAVVVESLELRVGAAVLLDHISMSVPQGEWCSILGPNGAGKSSLLKCLAGIHRHWSGSIRIYGEEVSAIPPRELARRVAYVPQALDATYLPFCVSDFVWMGRYPHLSPFTTPASKDRDAVEQAMKRAGVAKLAGRRLGTLSGGERQRVLVAAALAQGTDILLLDEPTASLDYRHQDEVIDLLRELNSACQVTIILVTHDVNGALSFGGKVVALDAARIVHEGQTEDLRNARLLERIYRAKFRLIEDKVGGRLIIAPREGRRV